VYQDGAVVSDIQEGYFPLQRRLDVSTIENTGILQN
jgi:hypothetical protein